MENIFALNNQVFGLNFRERRVSSKTRRAMRSEFVTPANSVEMTYDDICDVNGGGTLSFSVKWSTFTGMIIGSIASIGIASSLTMAYTAVTAACTLFSVATGGIFAAVGGLVNAALIFLISQIAGKIIGLSVTAALNFLNIQQGNAIDVSLTKWYLPNLDLAI